MSQSVRTKSKPPRASGPPAGDPFWTGERLGKLETEIVHIKEDIAEIKDNMATNMATKADIAALRESMDSSRESTKADTAALKENMATKADLVKTENRILRWIVGSMGTLIIAILGLIVAFVLRSL